MKLNVEPESSSRENIRKHYWLGTWHSFLLEIGEIRIILARFRKSSRKGVTPLPVCPLISLFKNEMRGQKTGVSISASCARPVHSDKSSILKGSVPRNIATKGPPRVHMVGSREKPDGQVTEIKNDESLLCIWWFVARNLRRVRFNERNGEN